MSEYISTQQLFENWMSIVEGTNPHSSIRIGDGEAVVLSHTEILTMDFINKFYPWVYDKNTAALYFQIKKSEDSL